MQRVEIPMPGRPHARPGKRGYPAVGWRKSGSGPRVVALGDSVTFGVGDEPGSDGYAGWGAHIARALDASYYLNISRMGARAHTVVSEQLPVALNASADIALIIVGGNDVLRGNFDYRKVARDVAHAVTELQTAGTQVVLMRLHDPRRTLPLPKLVREALGRRIDRVNNALDAAILATSDLKPLYIDAAADGLVYRRQIWHVDRMHPSAFGHRWIADLVLSALAKRGFAQVRPVEQATPRKPRAGQQILWLVRHGTPWILRRSVDLIPAAAFLLFMEMVFAKEYEDLTKGLQ